MYKKVPGTRKFLVQESSWYRQLRVYGSVFFLACWNLFAISDSEMGFKRHMVAVGACSNTGEFIMT